MQLYITLIWSTMMDGNINKFYRVCFKNPKTAASAFPEGRENALLEIDDEVHDLTELPFRLILKSVTSTKNGLKVSEDLSNIEDIWTDYQSNCLAWPLMSEKLKTIVSNHLTGDEGITWIKAKVFAYDDSRDYYLPKFQSRMDVLDEQKTRFSPSAPDSIVIPVFSLKKISKFAMFHVPYKYMWRITSAMYINNKMKKDIQKNKIIGIQFEEAPVSDT